MNITHTHTLYTAHGKMQRSIDGKIDSGKKSFLNRQTEKIGEIVNGVE